MPEDKKTQIDRRNKRFIPSDMEMLSGTTFTAFNINTENFSANSISGISVETNLTSGVQIHFALVSGNLTLVSGAGLVSSGSGLAISPLIQTKELQISGSLLFTSGASITSSGSGLSITPLIRTKEVQISGQLLFTSGSTIVSSGSGLSIAPTINTARVNISGTLHLESGAVITTSGSGITFTNAVTLNNSVSGVLHYPNIRSGTILNPIISGAIIDAATINNATFNPPLTISNTLTSGAQIHHPIISGNITFVSGANMVTSGSGILFTTNVFISGLVTATTGVYNSLSVSSTTVTTTGVAGSFSVSGAIVVNTTGTFGSVSVSGSIISTSGRFQTLTVSGTVQATTGIFQSILVSGTINATKLYTPTYDVFFHDSTTINARDRDGVIRFSGTDTHSVIQTMFNDVTTSGDTKGGLVYFRSGIYYLNASVQISRSGETSVTHIKGENRDNVVIMATGSTSFNMFAPHEDTIWEDITLDGGNGGVSGRLISCGQPANMWLENCRFTHNTNIGVQTLEPGFISFYANNCIFEKPIGWQDQCALWASGSTRISNCLFDRSNGNTSGSCLTAGGLANATISNNVMKKASVVVSGTTIFGYAFLMEPGGFDFNNVIFDNNVCLNGGIRIGTTASTSGAIFNTIISNNIVKGAEIGVIAESTNFSGRVVGLSIVDNQIIDSDVVALRLLRLKPAANLVVQGNYIKDSNLSFQTHAFGDDGLMQVNNVGGATITNNLLVISNTTSGTSPYGINCESGSNIIFRHNHILNTAGNNNVSFINLSDGTVTADQFIGFHNTGLSGNRTYRFPNESGVVVVMTSGNIAVVSGTVQATTGVFNSVITDKFNMQAAIPYEYYVYKNSGVTQIRNNSGIVQYSGVDTGAVINSMLSGANSNISIGFQPNWYSGATDIQNNGRASVKWYGNNAQFGMKIKLNGSGNCIRVGYNVFDSFIMSGTGAGFVFDNTFAPRVQDCKLNNCTVGISFEASNQWTEFWHINNLQTNNCYKSLLFKTPTGAGTGSYINGLLDTAGFNQDSAFTAPYTHIELQPDTQIDESKIINTRYWFNVGSGIGVYVHSGATTARTMWFKPFFENFAASGNNQAVILNPPAALFFNGRPTFSPAETFFSNITNSGNAWILGSNSTWRTTGSPTVGISDTFGASTTVVDTDIDELAGFPNISIIIGGTVTNETLTVEVTTNTIDTGGTLSTSTSTHTFLFTGTYTLNLSNYWTHTPNNHHYLLKNITARAKTNAGSTSATVAVTALQGGTSAQSTIMVSGLQWLGSMNSGANLVSGGATAMPTPKGYLTVVISGRNMFMPYFTSG